MTHKVHPKAFRIKEIGDWDTRGYYKNPARYLEEDYRIREFIKKKLGKVGIDKIEIERFPGKINIIISSARPGLIIGRGGEGVEELRKELTVIVFKKSSLVETVKKKKNKKKKEQSSISEKVSFKMEEDVEEKKEIRIEIREIKNPWTSAALSAQWVAQQIEKRVLYRRVLKQALSKISANKEIKGVRIEIAGRLNGAEIARRAWVSNGRLPRQTIRADIDYAGVEAYCSYGVVGIKIWLYKGEKFR